MEFLEVASNFKIPGVTGVTGVTDDAFRLRIFPYSPRGRTKNLLNSLKSISIATWNDLIGNILAKYSPRQEFYGKKMRSPCSFNGMTSLCLMSGRDLELLRKCPHNGMQIYVQLETFYNGLVPSSEIMLDASSSGELLSKSYTKDYDLI